MILRSYHPGISVDGIRDETGWALKLAPDLSQTTAPTKDEMAAVRKYDPKRIWTA
jgi:glutaconate CoA-transferase subunit B